MTSSNAIKFLEKVTLKGTDDQTYEEWTDFLKKVQQDQKKQGEKFVVV